jgi:hypothetical protein
MKRWERRRADTDDDGRDEEAPVAGGDALGRRPQPPHGGGDLRSTSQEAGTIRPGGPRGKERTTVEVGANGQQSGGGVEFVRPHLDGRGDAADATPLALLLSSSSSSSAIAEVDVVGGVTLSVGAALPRERRMTAR